MAAALCWALLASCQSAESPTSPDPAPVLAANATSPAAPDLAREPMRYPLQSGNVWKYRADVTIELRQPGMEPVIDEIVRTTKAEITGSESMQGRCYVVEERSITETAGDGGVVEERTLYRQDQAGLYEAATNPPPTSPGTGATGWLDAVYEGRPDEAAWRAAAVRLQARLSALRAGGGPMLAASRPGGSLPGELVRLSYPLRPGQEWTVIDDAFLMTAAVEGHEQLELPIGRTPAWRVRFWSTLYGPDDDIVFYYGREGYLGWRVTVHTEAIDEATGETIGQLVLHDVEMLQEVAIDPRELSPCHPTTALQRGGKASIAGGD